MGLSEPAIGDCLWNEMDTKLLVSEGKYELDSAAWSTYRNFDQIYNQVGQEMQCIDAVSQYWVSRSIAL